MTYIAFLTTFHLGHRLLDLIPFLMTSLLASLIDHCLCRFCCHRFYPQMLYARLHHTLSCVRKHASQTQHDLLSRVENEARLTEVLLNQVVSRQKLIDQIYLFGWCLLMWKHTLVNILQGVCASSSTTFDVILVPENSHIPSIISVLPCYLLCTYPRFPGTSRLSSRIQRAAIPQGQTSAPC